ncbi:MAG: precorrin-6y C5,15-methyltransferase (decarboxylating) subunit CbiE [Tissierellales bacterium]|jgi:cobalt-precorrin-7 (C5)-methyltransferase|nr:precorrin-6y C5,15-methyltransferase (decarboxylating) subunit CbiE [Tissierellales bacterium]
MKNKIKILGLGPGHPDYILPITKKLIDNSEIIVGGERNLKNIDLKNKKFFFIKTPLSKTVDFIKNNCKESRIAVLVSGDSGFYSLTSYIKKYFNEDELDIYPGISSLQYLFSRIGKTWEDACLMSMHGREENLIKNIKTNKNVGILTDKIWNPKKIAEKIIEKEILNKKIYIGENLSYDNERIIKLNLEDVTKHKFKNLNVMVVSDE